MKTKPSRQRRWQIDMRGRGLCDTCGKPSPEKVRCDHCALRRGVKLRSPLKSEWAAVDWSKRPKQIAFELGVSVNAVYARRARA